jgi:hypothetical protein
MKKGTEGEALGYLKNDVALGQWQHESNSLGHTSPPGSDSKLGVVEQTTKN